MKKLNFLSTRLGIVWTLIFFIWLKTVFAYIFALQSLHSSTVFDYILMFINPIGFTAAILTLTLFIKPTRIFYLILSLLSALATLMTYANVVYYREFTDFLSVNTITGGAGLLGKGFNLSSIPFQWVDIIYWLDLIILLALFLTKRIKMDNRPIGTMRAFKVFSFSFMLFALNFWFADYNEHRLISRQAQYDITYVVRYMGLGPSLITNGWYTHLADQARNHANPADFTKVQNYIKENRYLAQNSQLFSMGKNKNLIVIHLESFQQALIDLSIQNPVTGKEEVVTPFLNSIYHSKTTYSFSNFFNQVGQGKTSDAETMLETSTFGLGSGSFLYNFGPTQTFQAMPAILNQNFAGTGGYSSAVFHANSASFYNRSDTYRQMGYQNFFSRDYWWPKYDPKNSWGVNDKLLFYESVPWLEQLQQPFYVKYLTVTNHEPYTFNDPRDADPNFVTVNSGDTQVDNYFTTAHFLDQAVQEFYTYLKKSGLYENSVIVLYGDHYGISGSSESKNFLPYVAKNVGLNPDPNTFNDYDNTMLQRVPFMIDIPQKGKDQPNTDGHIISDKYVGEIDVMPTLEHIMGIDTQNYLQFGQDLFVNGRQEFVALRNRGFITPTITEPNPSNNVYYDTQSGQIITPTPAQLVYIKDIQTKVNNLLDMSDKFNTENLIRFANTPGFTEISPSQYNYSESATSQRLKDQQNSLKTRSTSLLTKNNGVSTQSEYITDAPEVKDREAAGSSSSGSSSSSSGSKTSSSSSSSSSSNKKN